jgi:hypothetical protein
MKKIIISLGLIIIGAAVCTSCNKSDDATADDTTLLMNKNWKVTGCVVSPAVNGNTDMYAMAPACSKDDTYRFNANNVHVFDEGATKCFASDPQTISGTWNYNNITKKLWFHSQSTADITVTELTATTLKGTAKDTSMGVIYTYTVTLNAP